MGAAAATDWAASAASYSPEFTCSAGSCSKTCSNFTGMTQRTVTRISTQLVMPRTESDLSHSEESTPVRDIMAVSMKMRDFSPSASQDIAQRRRINERLMQAARMGHYKRIVTALSEGGDIHARDMRKQTALMLAAASNSEGTVETTRFLLETLADLQARDDIGWTPLLHACRNNQKETVALLLEKRASVKVQAKDSKTAVMLATMDRGDGLVVDLVRQKACLDKTDVAGWSALFFACEHSRAELVRWLLKSEVNPCDAAKDGLTPLMVTADIGHIAIGQMLVRWKANINAANSKGVTALMFSMKAHKEEFATWILEKGADVTSQARSGPDGALEDALDIAQSFGMNDLRSKLVVKLRAQTEEAEAKALAALHAKGADKGKGKGKGKGLTSGRKVANSSPGQASSRSKSPGQASGRTKSPGPVSSRSNASRSPDDIQKQKTEK